MEIPPFSQQTVNTPKSAQYSMSSANKDAFNEQFFNYWMEEEMC